jgi:hypothetical protein
MSLVLHSSSPLMTSSRDKNNRHSPLTLMKKGLCEYVFNGFKFYNSNFIYLFIYLFIREKDYLESLFKLTNIWPKFFSLSSFTEAKLVCKK